MSNSFTGPTDYNELDASDAVAAARQANYELGRNGWSPSWQRILAEMGRNEDGSPIEDEQTLAPGRAPIVARELVQDHMEQERESRSEQTELGDHEAEQ